MRRSLDERWAVSITFVAAMFVSLLDMTIVNVALPALADEFGVGTDEIEWVVVGYLLSLAVFMPESGWIANRFGAKRTLLAALGVFTTASALCGVAGSLGQLVGFRVLQGVGGGLIVPVGTAMLFRAFPPAEQLGAYHMAFVVAAAIGVVAVLVATRVRDEDAVATMAPGGAPPPTARRPPTWRSPRSERPGRADECRVGAAGPDATVGA
jgi:MFS family permease